jgi:hypothetical protein
MRKGFWMLIVIGTVAACNNSSTTVSVTGDSISRELDTLGEKIGEKTEAVSDSVKATYNIIKESVQVRIDSIRANRWDTTK